MQLIKSKTEIHVSHYVSMTTASPLHNHPKNLFLKSQYFSLKKQLAGLFDSKTFGITTDYNSTKLE